MLQCNSVTEAYYDTGSYSMFEEQIDIQEVISDPSIYGSDLELQPLKNQYQQIRDHSTRGKSAANFHSDKIFLGCSTTSTHDLNSVNSEITSLNRNSDNSSVLHHSFAVL
ncbi:hypothetical protein Pint_10280 [Pistacia integerrima]|uniref:Uncharacterized protein n=1 Tax=Pistacia integerrima TaxID=434235 RepID=A0ACC0XJ42_9ROSI|nr:hypothetical protein Pint_10280 [Pistacia integerrima]